MTFGSTYSAVKAALVTQLDARSGLAATSVLYQAPERGSEVRGESGAWELIFFDDAEGTSGVRVFAGPSPLIFDEEYIQTCVIEVQIPDSSGTQQAVDDRAMELLYEVLHELSHQAEWDYTALGLGPADFEYVDLVPASWSTNTGFIVPTKGHGARIGLGIRVRARRLFSP